MLNMANNPNNPQTADLDSFREIPTTDQLNNDPKTTVVPESTTGQVSFSARSPSIIPTPVYDDASTIRSFTPPTQSSPSVTSTSIASVLSPPPPAGNSVHSPSPLSSDFINEEKTQQEQQQTMLQKTGSEAKTQVEDPSSQHNYEQSYREADEFNRGQQQHYGLLHNTSSTTMTSPLLTKSFMPIYNNSSSLSREMDLTEEIQLHETGEGRRNHVVQPELQQHQHSQFSTPPAMTDFSTPQQTTATNSKDMQGRVDMFMNKLRGYRSPSGDEPNRMEEGENLSREFGRPLLQKQRGIVFRQLFGGGGFPIFTWVSGIIMVGVFIYEIVRNHELSGSWIMTNPFNPMIGPNYMALVTMGSKFVPCMRTVQNYSPSTVFGNCYSSIEATCTVEQVCGFGGFNGSAPNQGFRFFTSIFLHAGVVHILLNLLTHFQTGAEVERTLGLIRYMVLYIVSGVWGFVLSAVLAGPTVSSMGCSGALFGLIGYTVIDLIMQWKLHSNPRRELFKLILVIIISLVLGLLPGLDNFAHIGGLVMGLLFGFVLAPISSYTTRKAKIIIWAGKILSLVLVVVLYAVLISKFYSTPDLSTVCPNCKYLSCLPVNGWCDSLQ